MSELEGGPRGAGPQSSVLQAEGLGYRFSDGGWAFRGLDFALEAGHLAVLAGKNGAGKTFFAKVLAGLLEPSEGRVLISGRDLSSIKENRALAVGYVFQDARLQIVGETVFDDLLFGPTNLGLGREEAEERARSALLACGLADREKSFVHSLSGGELRRLAIGGVLAMSPRALILDEPFANLDLSGVRSVLRIVREIAERGTALLVVTHEIEKVLGLANSFTIMEEGRIMLAGSPAEVVARGVEDFGLRDPFRHPIGIESLSWLD